MRGYNAISVQLKHQLPTGTELGNNNNILGFDFIFLNLKIFDKRIPCHLVLTVKLKLNAINPRDCDYIF